MNREKKIFSLLVKYKEEFDPEFTNTIPTYPKTLYEPAAYHFNAGGKRWRPFLIEQVSQLFGKPRKYSLPLEIVIEYIHNWSLIHDDIEDQDKTRRGKQTVWSKYGIDRAINVGDMMQGRTIELLYNGLDYWGEEKTLYLYKFMGRTVRELCEGQNMEFDLRNKKTNVTEKQYMEMIKRKTGALVKFGVVGIADVIGVKKELKGGLEEYSEKLPASFQIQDDVLNLIAEEKYGKEIGGDIKEGKRTIPLIHSMKNANKKEKKQILEIILKPRNNTTEDDVNFVLDIMKKYNSIDYTIKYSRRLAMEAAGAIRNLPDSEEKEVLCDMATWLGVERKF